VSRFRFASVASGLVLVVALQLALDPSRAQNVASTAPPGLTQREIDDPLEPLSLEPGVAPVLPPAPVIPDTAQAALPESTRAAAADSTALPPAEPAEQVLVVQCRQLLVSDPRQAERLAVLLRAGKSLDEARRAVGTVDIDESTRTYALDELQPELGAEVDSLAPGSWSRLREWRGRSALYQVVSKEEKPRDSIPALGEGLDAAEQQRVAGLRRSQPAAARAAPAPAEGDVQPATVVEKATPKYPEGIAESADVTVQVEVGLSDDYVGARIVSSTNAQFDQAALDAAQRSSYRSARRNGVPERGSVTIQFRFVAPGTPGAPGGQQPPGGGQPPD